MTGFHKHVYMLSFPNNNIRGDMWLCYGYDQKETRVNFPGKHESMRKTSKKKIGSTVEIYKNILTFSICQSVFKYLFAALIFFFFLQNITPKPLVVSPYLRN